jgi:hypothetical protein
MSAPVPRRSRGAVNVPAADGYHFGDDHPWGAEEQSSLIRMLRKVRQKFDEQKHSPASDTTDA